MWTSASDEDFAHVNHPPTATAHPLGLLLTVLGWVLPVQQGHVAIHVAQPVEHGVDDDTRDRDALLLPVCPLETMLPRCHHQALQEFPGGKKPMPG